MDKEKLVKDGRLIMIIALVFFLVGWVLVSFGNDGMSGGSVSGALMPFIFWGFGWIPIILFIAGVIMWVIGKND